MTTNAKRDLTGRRVRIDTRPLASGTGVGPHGVVVADYVIDTAITGMRIVERMLLIRIDGGSIVTRSISEIGILAAAEGGLD